MAGDNVFVLGPRLSSCYAYCNLMYTIRRSLEMNFSSK